MIELVQFLTCVGLLIYALVPHLKISEAGRILFSWGVLALMLHWVGIR